MAVQETRTIRGRTVEDSIGGSRGRVIRAGDPDYDDARTVRNGLIDRRPAMIVRCSGTSDVVDAVNFARDQGLTL